MENFNEKMITQHIEIDDKKFVKVEFKCRTTNEDKECSKLYRKINYIFLKEKNIQFPITTNKTEIIIKGDEYGLNYFNFYSVRNLIKDKYEFDSKFKYLLTIEIQYFNDEVIPFLIISIYKIIEFPKLISKETIEQIFNEDENQEEEICDTGIDNYYFFIHNEIELLDLIQVNYFDEDLFSKDKVEYLISNNVIINTFQDFYKYPIIDLRYDPKTGEINVFNDYLEV